MNLRQILSDKVNGASFISLNTLTKVDLLGGKSNPLKDRVFKRTTGSNVMVFCNRHTSAYDSMVRRRLEQEDKDPDTFVLSDRTWGARIPGEPFVWHRGKLYLEVIFLRPGLIEVLVDGNIVLDPYNTIPGYVRKQEAEQGGLERKVIIRDYKAESIRSIVVDKERFDL